MTLKIKHLVFDMGGVLIEIEWHRQVSKLLGKDIPFDKIHTLWGNSKVATAFEQGKIDYKTFVRDFIAEQNVDISEAEFEWEFMNMIVGDFPGIEELLAELKPRFTLSLLSNTNSKHWQYVQENSGFLKYLDHPFTSMEFGIMKPDERIYQRLIDELNCQPEEVLFFDDGKRNVEAARTFGLNAEQVFGPEDIRNRLKEYQLLS